MFKIQYHNSKDLPKCFVVHTGFYTQRAAEALDLLAHKTHDMAIISDPVFGNHYRMPDGECCLTLWSDDMEEAEDWLDRWFKQRCVDLLAISPDRIHGSDYLRLAKVFAGDWSDKLFIRNLTGMPWNPMKSTQVSVMLKEFYKFWDVGDTAKAVEVKEKLLAMLKAF